MKKLLFAAAVAVLCAACGKQAGESGTALYLEPGKLFSCRAPAHWKVLEDQGGAQRATFIGPPDGAKPFSQSIAVFYYAKSSQFASPKDYAKKQALMPGTTDPLVFKTWKGLAVFEFTAARTLPVMHTTKSETRKELDVLIPAPEGFFALVYSAPEDAYSGGEGTFRALLDSLDFSAGR